MHPPLSLVELQKTFGKILLGKLPCSTLKPKDRVEIYATGYLARLANCVKEQYPSVKALLGQKVFEEKISYPFVKKHTPKDWRLEIYGKGLTEWIKKEGIASLSPLLLPLAEIDEAFLKVTYPEERLGFLTEDVEIVESMIPLIEVRRALLQGLPIPPFEKKKRAFVVFSDAEGKRLSVEVDPEEAKLLKFLQTKSLDLSLELLVQDPSVNLDSLEELLPNWSAKWSRLKWIS